MKKIVVSLLVGVLLLTLMACGGQPSTDSGQKQTDPPKSTEQKTATATQAPTEQKTDAPTDSAQVGDINSPLELEDCIIQITEMKLVPSTANEGKYTLKMVYDVTNKKDEAARPLLLFSSTAFQNGIELDISLYNTRIESKNNSKEIKKDVTIKGCQSGFELEDMSEIELEIDDLINFESKPKYSFKINPEELEIEE